MDKHDENLVVRSLFVFGAWLIVMTVGLMLPLPSTFTIIWPLYLLSGLTGIGILAYSLSLNKKYQLSRQKNQPI